MGEKLTFCEKCRKDVKYNVTDVILKNKLKGDIYEYDGKKAICSDCGMDVYVAEIEDANLKSLYDVYREKNGIIALDKLLEIPSKYNIGKRPLSLLLGWGEMTFSRYCEGDMPTKQYSDMLLRIYDDPVYYLEVLEENKESLKSETSFEKSKKATTELLGAQNTAFSKIEDVIGYLLCKCEDITPLALQKAIYYIQGFYYAFTGKFMISEDCEAWVHGPVYKDIYLKYSSFKYDPINSINSNGECGDFKFTNSEKMIIDSVIKNLCCYSGKILEKFTHSELPWLKTRGDLPILTASDRIIQKELIGDYFVAVKNKYNMLDPSDIEDYAKKMFEKIK